MTKKGGMMQQGEQGHQNDEDQALGVKDGRTTARRRPADHYTEMGQHGSNTTKERQGSEFYRRIGSKGGSAKKKKHWLETSEAEEPTRLQQSRRSHRDNTAM